jgi:hypothetical protein
MNEWVSCVEEGHAICRLSLGVSEKLLAGLCVYLNLAVLEERFRLRLKCDLDCFAVQLN